MPVGSPLFSCAVYISSGTATVASRVAAQASRVPLVAVVDTFTDNTYARSSVKLVAERGPLLEAASAAVAEALRLVNLADEPHPAPHPRSGAVDMVSFMPLSEAATSATAEAMRPCDDLAFDLGARVADHVPVVLYGARAGRSLVEARRRTGFFASTRADAPRQVSLSVPPDLGPAEVTQRAGVSVVGAQPYVTNFNVQVGGASLSECREAARALRAELGVQVMALPHAGDTHEIGCNLQASAERDSPALAAVLETIGRSLPAGASVLRSYVIGLTPAQALERALEALSSAGGTGCGSE